MSEMNGHVLHLVILVAMVVASWVLPRTFGLLGLFAADFCGVIGLVSMGWVSLASGIWPTYDEPLVIFALCFRAWFSTS